MSSMSKEELEKLLYDLILGLPVNPDRIPNHLKPQIYRFMEEYKPPKTEGK